jgi:hypothetical protein
MQFFTINFHFTLIYAVYDEKNEGFIFRPADPEAELKQLSLEQLQEAKRLAVERGEHEDEFKANKKRKRS